MDAVRFDRWTRHVVGALSSRRGFVRLGLAGGLGLLAFGQVAEEALACRRNGKPCGAGRNGGCCSGTCKKGKCRPTKGAAGCTVQMDSCRGISPRFCPNKADFRCFLLDNGKPFCGEGGECVKCTSDAQCTQLAGGVPGKCIKSCEACIGGRACVYANVT